MSRKNVQTFANTCSLKIMLKISIDFVGISNSHFHKSLARTLYLYRDDEKKEARVTGFFFLLCSIEKSIDNKRSTRCGWCAFLIRGMHYTYLFFAQCTMNKW